MDKPYLFEISWETCNKVGGIHTVLKTKAPITVREYGTDSYFLLGPFYQNKAAMEMEEVSCLHPILAVTLESMRLQGLIIKFGRWLIDGYPYVILLDLLSALNRLDEWKTDLWNISQIPSGINDFEMNDCILFGYIVSWMIGDFSNRIRNESITSRPIIAHFHEWLSGVGLVLLQKRNIPVATIFTTHATLLGRYLCAGDIDFYNTLQYVNVDEASGKRGIYHRYCLERASANLAHVFTTVSHITAYESEHLLKRKPDGVLPNGLNVIKFSAIHEFQNLHAKSKAKIHSFIQGHFHGHYDFDLDNTLYFFISGRYEFRNKGVDLYLNALSRLNNRLKHVNSSVTVIAFIIMPSPNLSYSAPTLKGQAATRRLRESVEEMQRHIGDRIYESILKGGLPKNTDLLTNEDTIELKRYLISLRADSGLPPIVTHNMIEDATDPILCEVRRLGLFNASHDRVKLIFHPEFLSKDSPVLGLDYEEFVRGCHLGVFPSYYEPWGYTPAECTVLGVPSVTTNLSGFGCFIEDSIESPSEHGIYVIDRRLQSPNDSINQLVDILTSFCTLSRRQRIALRNRTERLSDLLDWKQLGVEYCKARSLALQVAYPEAYSHFEGSDFSNPNLFTEEVVSLATTPELLLCKLDVSDSSSN